MSKPFHVRSGDSAPAGPESADVQPASRDGLRRWLHESLREDSTRAGAALAIGCDAAFLAPQLADHATDVTVLDTSAGQIAQLARRFPEIAFLRHHPAQALPFEARRFQLVWCCDFIDRVFDPAAALRELYRVLAPGGTLLLAVPDHGPIRNVIHAFFRRAADVPSANPRVRQFTRASLIGQLRGAAFAGIRVGTSRTGGAAGDFLLKARKPVAVVAPRPRAARPLAPVETLVFAPAPLGAPRLG